jgi:hypothetical protein
VDATDLGKITRASVHVEIEGKRVEFQPNIYFRGYQNERTQGELFPGNFVIYPKRYSLTDRDGSMKLEDFYHCIYLPQDIPVNLLIKLFLIQPNTKHFRLVYPETDDLLFALTAPVKIWEIHYPSEIKVRPEYLDTQFPEPDLYHSWMFSQ